VEDKNSGNLLDHLVELVEETQNMIRKGGNQNSFISWLQWILSLIIGWFLGQITLQLILQILKK
jgi:hypothetical protein